MSGTTSNNSSTPTLRNILWAGTYYNYVEYDEKNRNSDIIWESEAKKLPYFNVFLRFQYQRLNSKYIRLTCARTIPVHIAPDVKTDYGYTLLFHCFISIANTYSLVSGMSGEQTIASETFHLKENYNYKPFQSKILVKVIEHDILESFVYFRQEKDFQEVKERFFNYESVLRYLCYILDRPRVQDIFTGRQDYEFATLKTNYIKRAACFVKDIADYLRRKDTYVWVPILDWEIELNYILNDEQAPISNKDLIKGYNQAHHMGLRFLADISRDTIIGRLGDPNFVIEALQAADNVNDEILLGEAAQAFHFWGKAILNSEKWLKFLNNSTVKCQILIYSINRLAKTGSQFPHQLENRSTSNFFELF